MREEAAKKPMLERWFDLRARGTTAGTEVLAGITTFMVMAYIIFVNPAILNFSGIKDLQNLGPGFAPTLAATCLVAGVMTIVMGVVTNYPFAVASGMGLNAVVAFQLIVGMKLPWSAAMGVIFLEGIVITILVLTGFREAVMDAIPLSLKRAIGVGIGLFILFIGVFSGGLVKPGPPGAPVTLGDFNSLPVLVTLVGLFLTMALMALRVRGALLIGILHQADPGQGPRGARDDVAGDHRLRHLLRAPLAAHGVRVLGDALQPRNGDGSYGFVARRKGRDPRDRIRERASTRSGKITRFRPGPAGDGTSSPSKPAARAAAPRRWVGSQLSVTRSSARRPRAANVAGSVRSRTR